MSYSVAHIYITPRLEENNVAYGFSIIFSVFVFWLGEIWTYAMIFQGRNTCKEDKRTSKSLTKNRCIYADLWWDVRPQLR